MSRPLRLDHAGAVWHLTSRGNERRAVYRDDEDRRRFLEILGKTVEACRWRVHAFVLMGNHYHLLMETPEATLSRGMRQLNSTYTQKFNRRHRRVGHLFQGRFKAILVEKESHLLELARYVVLNPVRAGLARTAGEWRWSNYRATAGLTRPPGWLEVNWTLAQFRPAQQARRRYRHFVAEGRGAAYAPWEQVASQIYLGSESFLRAVQRMIPERRRLEIPRLQQTPGRPTLDQLVAAVCREFGISETELRSRRQMLARRALAHLARREAFSRLSDFAPSLGIQTWAASHLAFAGESLAERNRAFRGRLQRIRESLS